MGALRALPGRRRSEGKSWRRTLEDQPWTISWSRSAWRGVAQAAPGELPLFTATATAYLVDPDEALKRRKQRDEVLGFGVGEVVTLMAPVALAVAREMVHFLIG